MIQTTPSMAQPTVAASRISSLDTIRGISLLGILLMNIVGFGLYKAYFDPTNNGGSTGWNLNVWWMTMMLFEGTMRGMFSMLFGAGILLFTAKSSVPGREETVTDLFFRRLMWMVVFGVIHCYLLLWDGEILYTYAIVGMFAFSFRHLSPRNLLIGTFLILLIPTFLDIQKYRDVKDLSTKVEAVKVKVAAGNANREDSVVLDRWNALVKEDKATPEQLKEEMDARSKGYWSIVLHKIPVNQWVQTYFLYRINFWDTLAMMLWGMAFLKLGILKAAKSKKFYLTMLVIGYSIGLTVNYIECSHMVENNFSLPSYYRMFLTYNLGRIAMTCGHIALIMLFIKSGWLSMLQRSLAAVGQMAFTNYIVHTIICNFIFLGYGLSKYGKLQRYELYYIVIGIWVFQLIISPIWLKYFRFGPLEWLWRSLTYWKVQPFRKRAAVAAEV